MDTYACDLRFFLNGDEIVIRDADPTVLLADYLRSPGVGLTGTKIGCKEGGCGACTVLVSSYDAVSDMVAHRSINSCLRPIVSLDGMSVTTIEGTGSVNTAVSPVQFAVAMNNGTQCGYCTPGFVMNMTGLLLSQEGEGPTKLEIQEHNDGNICRCTGYRPILFGFEKEFASDWNSEVDERCTMSCKVDPAECVERADEVSVTFPDALRVAPRAVRFEKGADGEQAYKWIRPTSLEALLRLVAEHRSASNLKLLVGNTSVGVYDKYVEDPHVLIDIAHVATLGGLEVDEDGLRIGAAVTYFDFLTWVRELIEEAESDHPERLAGLKVLEYMAHRTAGAVVRNAASLGGNTMLVLRHIAEGIPFPSDLFTAFAALGTRVTVSVPSRDEVLDMPLLEYAEMFVKTPELREEGVLLRYHVPFTGDGEFAEVYKTALREVNSHAIVNAGFRVRFGADECVEEASIVYAGLASVAVRFEEVEQYLVGQEWNWDTLSEAEALITRQVDALLEDVANSADPDTDVWEGFTDEYRRHLTQSFFYKFFVKTALEVAPGIVSADVAKAGERTDRPLSRGTQGYRAYEDEYPVNEPYIKLEAFLQATGEAVYPRDIPLPHRGLEAAYTTSRRARAGYSYRLPDQQKGDDVQPCDLLAFLKLEFPGVVDFITAAELPEDARLQGDGKQQPMLAVDNRVDSFGQAMGLVLADDRLVAIDAAHFVDTELVHYEDEEPILTIQESEENDGRFKDNPPSNPMLSHVWKIIRGSSDPCWYERGDSIELDGIRCRVVRGTQTVGSQIHFYMETQTALALPGEEGQMVMWPSSQDADTVQTRVAHTLGVPANKVDVRIKRVGGGYGGKTTQPPWLAVVTAFAAQKHNRPVRNALKREIDTGMFGHRHPGEATFAIAIATGEDDEKNKGKLMAMQTDVRLNGGMSLDCSFIISDCFQFRADSAYNVPHYGTTSDVYRTNITSNGAFRTVGLIQGLVMQEEAIEAAAHSVGMLPEDVRAQRLYKSGDETPFGQSVGDFCYIEDVFKTLRDKSKFDERLAEIETFNAENRWRKRGISLMPVKYASGYNLTLLEQAGALVEVFDQDGSILVRTGGVDMGQGLNTKIAQIAAQALNVPLALVRVAELDTSVVPNPISTGGSTGTAFNGRAVREACQDLRTRLEQYCDGLREANGDDWCKKNNVNYWDYPEQGWKHVLSEKKNASHDDDLRRCGDQYDYVWRHVVVQAYLDRENLSAQVRTKIKGGEKKVEKGAYFRPGVTPEPLNEFVGFTFSAACTEVEIDVLTGETVVLRADIMYDMGKSLNPAIDIGQVEGAFVQGLGYVMYEELVYQPEGHFKGRLNTLNTWRYKPPAATSIPLEMHVDLFPLPDKARPEREDPLYSSKDVGEPPMVLAVTAFFAIKHAILAARRDRGLDEWFSLEQPATVQRIRTACRVGVEDLGK